jgi:hypothetical protein
MEQVTFGFDAVDIVQLADELARALGIRLHSHHSPMIGPWYSSVDLSAVFRAMTEGGPGAVEQAAAPSVGQGGYELVLNDPEPGYTAPEFPAGGHCLLRVHAGSIELQRIESKLRDAGLPFKRLKGSVA